MARKERFNNQDDLLNKLICVNRWAVDLSSIDKCSVVELTISNFSCQFFSVRSISCGGCSILSGISSGIICAVNCVLQAII